MLVSWTCLDLSLAQQYLMNTVCSFLVFLLLLLPPGPSPAWRIVRLPFLPGPSLVSLHRFNCMDRPNAGRRPLDSLASTGPQGPWSLVEGYLISIGSGRDVVCSRPHPRRHENSRARERGPNAGWNDFGQPGSGKTSAATFSFFPLPIHGHGTALIHGDLIVDGAQWEMINHARSVPCRVPSCHPRVWNVQHRESIRTKLL